MCNVHTNFRVRRGVGAPKADACALLTSALPFVHRIMTAAQIEQLQAVLDADGNAASNSVLVKKWNLSSTKLLTPEALRPITKNPDEAAYLNEIRQTLLQKGVWLRIDEQPLRFRLTPYLYLSLGNDGDEIPTKDGHLTRENLLGNRVLGTGYEMRVDNGNFLKAELEKTIKRLRRNIEAGEMQCKLLAQQVLSEDVRITGAKNLLGGRGFAGFPFSTIWAKPRKLMERAEQLFKGGNVTVSQGLLVQAAVLAAVVAKEINTFIDDTNSGAERSVAVLEWVEIAGAWAGLFAGSGGAGSVGARSKTGGTAQTSQAVRANPGGVYPANATHYYGPAAFNKTAARTGHPVKNVSPAAYQQTNLAAQQAVNKTVNQANVTKASTGGGGGVLNRYDIATQKRIQEQLKGAVDEVNDFLKKNPNAPFAEKMKVIERAHSKWGIEAIVD